MLGGGKMLRYEYKRKPRKCPVCGSVRIANILYGLIGISEELQNDVNAGKITFGGCVTTGDDPMWQCADCETKFYKKRHQSKNS
jgi:hypothetical protein